MTAEASILSCGVVVVRNTQSSWETVMLRAYKHWDFPKGMMEAGESEQQTAIREVREETSIDDLHFEWGDRSIRTGPYNRGKVSLYFLASTEQESITMGISPELGRPEHHEYRWLSFDEAFDLATPRVRNVVVWARQIINI